MSEGGGGGAGCGERLKTSILTLSRTYISLYSSFVINCVLTPTSFFITSSKNVEKKVLETIINCVNISYI